jgi:diguanylate cyclase (GGDEF)-like protein
MMMLVVCFVWVLEERLAVIFNYDRIGYIASLVVFMSCYGLSRWGKKTPLSRILVFCYLVLYLLVLIVITFLQAVNSGTIYTIASTLQWMPIIYVVSFLFLTNKQAIVSAIGIYVLMVALLILAHSDIFALQNPELQAMLLHAALSQVVCIFCLFGVIKLKNNNDAATLRAEKMEKAANLDGLLGIGNRRMLQNKLNTLATDSTPFSLLLIDVDHFKAINDTHGHLVGDDILREITLSMEKSLRPEDTIGRWGGEEFLVLAKATTLKHAQMLAERVRQGVEQQVFSVAGRVTVSIGVAQFQPDASVSHIFSMADKALYEAKSSGRNKVIVSALS